MSALNQPETGFDGYGVSWSQTDAYANVSVTAAVEDINAPTGVGMLDYR